MDIKGDSGLWRRIRLYLIGFIIGLISVYFIFGNKDLKVLTPGMLKLDQLAAQTIKYSDTARCQMKCQSVTEEEVKLAMTDAKVDSKKSKDFNQREPMFNFTGHTPNGKALNIICVEVDSVTRIITVKDLAKPDTCKCP
ncbi:MAG TPA: DUF4258 domain-containing protein [Bacteroidia bacterium]|jgi:hypothetical protein|nr:DUF4258 domain-containing protein [Bacteroidia bacterium]